MRTSLLPRRIERPLTVKRDAYNRARDLPRLMPLWPEDLADETVAGSRKLLLRLENLLRRERQRGLSGDWSYDLARHRQLLVVYRAEKEALRSKVAVEWLHKTARTQPDPQVRK